MNILKTHGKKVLYIGSGLLLLLVMHLLNQEKVANEWEIDSPTESVLAEENEETTEELKSVESSEPKTLFVDLKGEVMNPGVYEVQANSRVQDAIEEAGGFTKSADSLQVNLALKVWDEMLLYIPKQGEKVTLQTSGEETDGKINVNTATKEQLMELNGIGDIKAEDIIGYREENGGFSSIEELLEVKGIGEKTLENMREDLAELQ